MARDEIGEISIPVRIETGKLDTAIEKAKELVSLLERANELIQSLGNTTINNYRA